MTLDLLITMIAPTLCLLIAILYGGAWLIERSDTGKRRRIPRPHVQMCLIVLTSTLVGMASSWELGCAAFFFQLSRPEHA